MLSSVTMIFPDLQTSLRLKRRFLTEDYGETVVVVILHHRNQIPALGLIGHLDALLTQPYSLVRVRQIPCTSSRV